MNALEQSTMVALTRAANTYLNRIDEEMKLSRERFELEQQLRDATMHLVARQQPPPEELIWENRRYDIAKRCLAALAPCAVPGRMGEREVNPAVAARTAIELADALIKQLQTREV